MNDKTDKIYVVNATVDKNGVVLSEVFTDADKANEYSRSENIKNILREEYSDKMADHKSLEISYHIRTLLT